MVKQLAHNENGYRDVLKEIFMSESNLIVLDCEKKILEEVLKQCQQVLVASDHIFRKKGVFSKASVSVKLHLENNLFFSFLLVETLNNQK